MIKKIIKIILIIVVIIGVALYFYIQHKKPQRDGELKLDHLSSDVSVLFDRYGIPHIYANNDEDMYRALGYVHAQDRLFQMELLRRLSQGKLADILGEKLIGVDRLFRTLGLEDYAGLWLSAINKRTHNKISRMLDAYLDGVNQFVKNGVRPVEFDLLGIPAHQYSKTDIISIMGYMSFSFAQGFKDDPLVTRLSQQFPQAYLDDMGILSMPGKYQLPVDAFTTTNQNGSLDYLQETRPGYGISGNQLQQITQTISARIHQILPMGLFHGSNSWILSPQKSTSGKAIFVNDPHIAFSQPAVWYEADIHSDHTHIYGHFLGLIPFPMLGFNENLAWGLTMFENDDMDLYAEKINPENEDQYWAIDHWENFITRTETIHVKDHKDVNFVVKTSRHGPVVNSMFTTLKAKKDPMQGFQTPIALWWKFLDSNNQQVEAFFELPYADTLEKAAAAAAKIHAPGLNLMYANAHGDIAWWATAKLPIRPAHANSKMILDGASGKDDILGYYDFSHNPHLINPASGYIYTANNQPQDMGDGLVPGYYSPLDRPKRITEFLQSKQKFSKADMKILLMDNTPPTAKMLQRLFVPVLEAGKSQFSGNAIKALQIFESWKGDHNPDEVGASIYTEFRLRFVELAMADEIGKDLFDDFQYGFLLDRTLWKLVKNEDSPWWDNIHTDKKETRNELIVEAWKQAIDKLENRLGHDTQKWQWRNEVQMIHPHILGKVNYLDKIFNVGPFPSRAAIEGVNNLMFKTEADHLGIIMGPSTRRIIDFADINHTLGINPTGQSGVPFDPHYADQAEDYANGKFRPQYLDKKEIEANLEGKLLFKAH